MTEQTNSTSLTVLNTQIRRDADGRYCLNDCHRAAGGEKKHGPSYFLITDGAKGLAAELTDTGNPVSPVSSIKGGSDQGSYVAKELVYAYAMWISPAFHLTVIRAFDAMVTGVVSGNVTPFVIPQTLPDALRLAADLADQRDRAEASLAVAGPKAEAFDELASLDGLFTLTQAAKACGWTRDAFIHRLNELEWIYRDKAKKNWLGYAPKEKAGYLDYKAFEYRDADGHLRPKPQVALTAKGLARARLVIGEQPKPLRPFSVVGGRAA